MHLSSKSASDFQWHGRAVSFSTMRKERIYLTPLLLSAVTVVLLLFFTLWLIASSVHPSEKSFFLPSPLPLPASFPRDVLELPPLSLCFSMHNELVTKMVVQQWTLPWQLSCLLLFGIIFSPTSDFFNGCQVQDSSLTCLQTFLLLS